MTPDSKSPSSTKRTTTSLSAPDIARSLRGILSKVENVKVLLDTIVSIDATTKVATSAEHQYPFDYLVLACGARTSFFGKDEWAQHTIGLKSLSDALRVRARVLGSLERAEITKDLAERRRLMTIVLIKPTPSLIWPEARHPLKHGQRNDSIFHYARHFFPLQVQANEVAP